ncbi:hypothetical protein BKP45_15140 [Anaerobacillus alkalidiazotrophicus]|uniref:SCP2 domain-containing protein n=1 Tax=Anaerobacillus alkalidiazotrophicus TaxID=472963 RepID=A0A1S2M349_9BACI|nr:SCP2 sterol-binding domain-containing protein [Anaerobacillus alkalidiazotrophicus]OIJ18863.1 hypothetical protein BKP45_15140 [Anaerobacillus alkalidiazotrophicus]
MVLDEVLQRFRQQFLQATHLKLIFKEKPYCILLEPTDGKVYSIKFERDQIAFVSKSEVERFDVVISGVEKALLDVLTGKERLQRMYKRNELKIEGTYSAVLKAETIFYLNQCEVSVQ